jgi:cytochrome c-type biogenesis protein CcmH/NrfG
MKTMADKAAQPLLEKLKQNPNDYDLLAQTAATYGKGRQFDVAVQYYEQAAKVKPSAEIYTDMAGAYHYAGAEDKSMESLNHALELDPKYANALFNLGMLKLRVKGDNKGAIALWEKLIKTNPDNPHRAEIEQMIAKVKQSGGSFAKQ